MRKNFNFKAEWAIAIQTLCTDLRLRVYQVIITMGFNDMSLDEALADMNVAISDSEALNLLAEVDKVLKRRRRARQRAAARRLEKATASCKAADVHCCGSSAQNTLDITANPDYTTTDVNSAADITTPPAPTLKHRHKYKKNKSSFHSR